MKNRTIGSLSVSCIGLGCMNMSMGYGEANDTVSNQLLNEALDTGYTFLDTALIYGSGHNETLIGKSLVSRRRDYVLATKCGLTRDGINGRPDTLIQSCDDSLRRLNTDVIDLYYLHRMDPDVPIEESVGALARLQQAGKIREIGLSEVSTKTLKRAHKEASIAALQSEYSLWSRTPERGILDACETLGVAFVPFSPLGRAFLTGTATDVTQLPDDDLRATIARPRFEPEAYRENSKLLEPFAAIARQNDCSMAQLALAWLLHQRNGTLIPIPGTKHIEFMKENAGAAKVTLTAATLDAVNQLINESTIIGNRYTDDRMATADAEQD